MGKISIYTLTNPINNNVYYVGITAYPTKRFLNHLKTADTSKTTGYLVSLGLQPIMHEIDSCDNDQHKYRIEEYWIHQFRCWGFILDNKNNVAVKSTVKKLRWPEGKRDRVKPILKPHKSIKIIKEKTFYSLMPPF